MKLSSLFKQGDAMVPSSVPTQDIKIALNIAIDYFIEMRDECERNGFKNAADVWQKSITALEFLRRKETEY